MRNVWRVCVASTAWKQATEKQIAIYETGVTWVNEILLALILTTLPLYEMPVDTIPRSSTWSWNCWTCRRRRYHHSPTRRPSSYHRPRRLSLEANHSNAENLEMAVTDEMLSIAKEVTRVLLPRPEKREELTTEAGLDVLGNRLALKRHVMSYLLLVLKCLCLLTQIRRR